MSKHREIYKAHYGQDSIKDGNVIHHLDHDPTNNSIINLAQMSKTDHGRLHAGRYVPAGLLPTICEPLEYVDQEDNRQDNDDRSKIIWFDI